MRKYWGICKYVILLIYFFIDKTSAPSEGLFFDPSGKGITCPFVDNER
jgi:hypothetical protein